MRHERLRGVPDLGETYPAPHDHRQWGEGHAIRVKTTIALACGWARSQGWTSVADLSCGNAAIVEGLGLPVQVLGDVAPGYELCGQIEATVHRIGHVDAFVCSETLEHLEFPKPVLCEIRDRASWLVYSTPVGAWGDENPEHVHAWDAEYVEGMLDDAGWENAETVTVPTEAYTYLIGVAR